MNILVTGASGFVASHLFRYLLVKYPNANIYGTKRWRSQTPLIKDIGDKIKFIEMNLEDQESVERAILAAKPDWVFHLAAQSYVPSSFIAPDQTVMVNATGTRYLLAAVYKHVPNARIQIAGTSEEYGLVSPYEVPIKENNPLRPTSPYGISKVKADLWANYYHRAFGVQSIITRGFNHSGPGRGVVFAESNWCYQASRIKLGKQKPVIEVGNLEAVRDYTDVRDMVAAYVLALEKGISGETYNICSGKGMTMREVLNLIIKIVDIEVNVVTDLDRLRPSDVPLLIGSCAKFKADTGWKPKIPFEQTIKDIFDFWMEKENLDVT